MLLACNISQRFSAERWKVFETRITNMMYFLLAPEIVLVWAARQ